ncbi:MAG: PfkB family carbohydrate kinase [Candidatus Zixiibacteriota bacterium]
MPNKKLDCLGLGIMPLDVLLSVPHYPNAGGKIDATDIIVQGGGPVANALVGLSRLGMKTAMIAAVGNDFAGALGLQELKRERVDTRYIVVKKAPSAVATGFVENGSGRRTIALHRKIAVSPRDLRLSAYPAPRIIHLDGRDLESCVALARWGRWHGSIISFDIGSMRNDISPILPLVDHLVVADAFALPFTGARHAESAIRKLSKRCYGTIVITQGTHGTVGREDGVVVHQRAFKVKNVDTTGAGDSFHAGYLYGLLKEWSLSRRLLIAAATAALKCTRPGARTGAPTLREVQTFLRKRPSTYA